MRKVWGWILFLAAIFGIRVIINASRLEGDANVWILLGWIVWILLCLFGWYKFALRKPNKVNITQQQPEQK